MPKLSITVSDQVADHIARLHVTGLWGNTVEETTERLLCAAIRAEIVSWNPRIVIPNRKPKPQ